MALGSKETVIEQAIAGAVVSFPTDTVPALAVQPEQGELIYTLKQRDRRKPLILMAATVEDLKPYLGGSSEEWEIWRSVMDAHWPGELTLVLPAGPALPPAMNFNQDGTLGVRIPNLAIALDILQETGPLATTSANRSGEPPLTSSAAITQAFPSVTCLDCPLLGNGQPSTVAQWRARSVPLASGYWEILRQGRVQI